MHANSFFCFGEAVRFVINGNNGLVTVNGRRKKDTISKIELEFRSQLLYSFMWYWIGARKKNPRS